MNPANAAKQIETRLQNYVRSTLPIERSMPKLTPQIEALFARPEMRMVQDPYLELIPPYTAGASLQDLANKQVIHQDTANIFAKFFLGHANADPAHVRLHMHQERAVRAVCSENKNLVVCSGTGSGKTESFLIPLVDFLVRQHAANALGGGVRAMLLYPMNALVNDQIRRLRTVLRWAPHITFGKFTGETDNRERVASELEENAQDLKTAFDAAGYEQTRDLGFDDEAALPNEVTSRSAWRANPAHILVTNYSMLERLLLEPTNATIFGQHWKFIVLDEAHCYSGSQGTEIAWLVRRVKHRVEQSGVQPDTLRYLATSATLIDSQESEAIKKERIRNEFASKLFPAVAESFSVQFGETDVYSVPQGTADVGERLVSNYHRWTNELEVSQPTRDSLGVALVNFPDLLPPGESKLFPVTQAALAAKSMAKKLQSIADHLPQQADALAASDAVALLRHAVDSSEAGLMALDVQALTASPFSDGQGSITALLDFIKAGVGEFNQWDKWRGWLHDAADSRRSSMPGDNDAKGQRKKIGNRLHILNEWSANPPQLSLEGMEYLLSVASDIAITAETALDVEFRPGELHLELADATWRALADFSEKAQAMVEALNTVETLLVGEWQRALGVNADGDISSLLALGFGNDPRLAELVNHLRLCSQDGPQNATLSNAARHLFPDAHLPDAEAAVVSLIQLGTLAVPPGQRRPLLDVRYHQLLRGVSGVMVTFDAYNQPILTPGQTGPGLPLGCCRDCGQPFLLGYAREAQAAQGTILLSPIKGADYVYLHALAWAQGVAPEDAEEQPIAKNDKDHLFDPKTLKLSVDEDGEGIPMHWHVAPAGGDSPEFLSECPCCRSIQNNVAGTRFGVITPYQAQGTQLRLVALDELYRCVDASPDPAARKQPGNGRKVLAFSDSRSGAARLATQLQEFFADVTMRQVAVEALTAFDKPKQEWSESLRMKVLEACLSQVPERYREQDLVDLLSTVPAVAAGLWNHLENHNADRLLEAQNNNGEDLALKDAAMLRLFQALKKQGRHGLLQNGIRVTSPQFSNVLPSVHGLDGPGTKALCEKLLSILVEMAEIQPVDNWPDLKSIFRYAKRVTINGASINNQATIRFVTKHGNSRLIRAVLAVIPNATQAQAQQILDALWPIFTQGASSPLTGDAQMGYRLRPSALVLLLDGEGQAMPNPQPYEREAHDQATRDIIPLRVEEHTAQIATERGSAYQRGFTRGQINILSCSTTFEMGVDLGDLSCVFLSNLPPAVANYRQRAGRAGRRPGSPAYVLTFVGDSAHDLYYWQQPEKLLFGPMQAPVIYLENKLFRARHLRAEALHLFLKWCQDQQRSTTQGTKLNGTPRDIRRHWGTVGDFFLGVRVGRFNNGQRPITSTFTPLANELSQWCLAESTNVQTWNLGLSDITPDSLNYCVASDLLWQLMSQDGQLIAPFNLDEQALPDFRELGGPNIPTGNAATPLDENPRRREVQHYADYEYRQGAAVRPQESVSASQGHLINDQTISWLARNRVLPKYGFPVDVIKLLPDSADTGVVRLERDLRIGLFEYAPGQKVFADKRIFESSHPVVFRPDGFQMSLEDAANQVSLCQSCGELDLQQNNQICIHCQGAIITIPCVRPDAFQAKRSRAPFGANLSPQRGHPQHLYTGGYRSDREIQGLKIKPAESESGTIRFLNRGPDRKGFNQGQTNYSLLHDVRTDIAIWLVDPTVHNGWAGTRITHAYQSALHAILRAIARVKSVELRDVGGLVQPVPPHQGQAFVLFDESSGGGGTVLHLHLTGQPAIDTTRIALIQKIIAEAIRICEQCPECGVSHVANPDAEPKRVQDFLALQNQQGYREAVSCYHCLRSYQNQRYHATLDRIDGAKLLTAIAVAPPPAALVPTPPNQVISDQIVVARHPRFPGGEARGKWFHRLQTGDKPHLIRLRNETASDPRYEMTDAEFAGIQFFMED